MEIISS